MPTPSDPKDLDLAARMAADPRARQAAREFIDATAPYRYAYNFSWLGRPVIQHPEDLVAMQEILWKVRPDVVIETGIAHGGSLIFYASMLQLLGGDGFVAGIDIDIRPHNRVEIESHPLASRLRLIEGSSIAPETLDQVGEAIAGKARPLVVLDSNHTRDHVLEELKLYSPLVRAGSYVVVFDTVVEWMDERLFAGRPWRAGNSPMNAVQDFLATNDRFEIDSEYDHKLLVTVAPGGYLRCVRDPD